MVWGCIVLLCPEMWINRLHSETQTNKAAMDGYVLYGGARFDGTLAARRQCGVLRHILGQPTVAQAFSSRKMA